MNTPPPALNETAPLPTDAASDALAATGLSPGLVAAVSQQLGAPADPQVTASAQLHTRLTAVENMLGNIVSVVEDVAGFVAILRGHFGSKL